MNTKQEQWIDDIMGSLQHLQPAAGNPHLHTRIMARLRQPVANRQPMQLKWAYSFTALFAIMLLVNVWGWSDSDATTTDVSVSQQSTEMEKVISDFSLDNNYTSLP